MANLDGSDEFFDSRDVIERLAEIEAEYSDNVDDDEEFSPERHIGDEDDREEFIKLAAFRDEVNSSEFDFGMTFIREGEDFVEYCKEFLEDCGYIPKDLPSFIVIDFEETADNMRADYSEVEFFGTTYLHNH